MQPGILTSIVGHVAVFALIVLPWGISAEVAPRDGVAVVPVEIVDVALEANVRALSTHDPEEEAAAAAETSTPTSAQPISSPQPERPRQRNDDFSLDDISGLVNTERPPRERTSDGQRADRNQAGAGLGTEERATLESRAAALVRARLRTCWRTTADLPDPERLHVVVSFQLNRNGTLNGQPRVVSPRNYTFDPIMNEAVRRALSAVRACDLTSIADDPVVGQYYEVWRDQEVNFGVRAL